jgi:hypothetical protein
MLFEAPAPPLYFPALFEAPELRFQVCRPPFFGEA